MKEKAPRTQEHWKRAGQEILQYIYSRAGRITANKDQRHLRDFSEDEHEMPQ